MTGKHLPAKADLSKFTTTLVDIQNKQVEFTTLYQRLAVENEHLLVVINSLEELMDELSVARMMVLNSKPAITSALQVTNAADNQKAWQSLVTYITQAQQIAALAENMRDLALGKLANTPDVAKKYESALTFSIDFFKTAITEVSQYSAERNNFDLQILFGNAEKINLTHTQTSAVKANVSPNFIFAAAGKIVNRMINAVQVPVETVVNRVMTQRFKAPDKVSLLNINHNGQTTPAIFREAEHNSDECVIFLTGAGDHALNGLETLEKIAEKIGTHYLAVDHVDQNATQDNLRIEKIASGIEYLMKIKKIPLENIILVGHSNGLNLALKTAAYCKMHYGVSPKIVGNNSYETREEATINLAQAKLKQSATHQAAPSLGETGFAEQSINHLATKFFHKALAENNSAYNAEEMIEYIGRDRVANIYTGAKTKYNDQGQKLTKSRDQILFKSGLGRKHNKQHQQANPQYHQAIGEMDFTLPSGEHGTYKDKYRSNGDGYINVKLYLDEETSDIHNYISIDSIGRVVEDLRAQQALLANQQTTAQNLQQRFVTLLAIEGLETAAISLPSGLNLSIDNLLLMREVFAQLAVDPNAVCPTQKQLIALFQTDGVIAELITRNPNVMKRMLTGDGSSAQVKKGLDFLEKKMAEANLQRRMNFPDGRIDDIGSYLTQEQVKNLHQKIQEYLPKLKHSALRLSKGFFEEEQNQQCVAIKKSQHKRQQAVDLDEIPEIVKNVCFKSSAS